MLPAYAHGLVVFAHGSGSSRASPRNRAVAAALQRDGVGSLLIDLLTEEEAAEDARTYAFRFRIGLLAARLAHAIDWVGHQPSTRELPLGLFGASTGGAAALMAAAERPERIRALVLRGARSDLADGDAPRVRAPTLFVVGGQDALVLEANRHTAARLAAPYGLSVIAGASHLFEEPGALDAVTDRTARWFRTFLVPDRPVGEAPRHAVPSGRPPLR